jgi:glycosyltransferase involved in cell wall biosynthesis
MLWGAWCAGWVASRARASRAQLLHAHFAYEPACVAVSASTLSGLPYTVTVHALDMYVRTRGLETRLQRADRVVTVCDYNVEQLRVRCPGLATDHIRVVYCGVDPHAFGCSPVDAIATRVLSVGRLVPKKGFDVLLRAIADVRGRGVDVTCEIVGEGPERQHLEDLIADLHLGENAKLSGALSPSAVAGRMCGCDVFVLACRIDEAGDRDSMPVVVKEAMASRRPVIVTATVGNPEMVDEQVGHLVPADDVRSLADAIDAVLRSDEATRRQLGDAGRRRVERRFDLRTETAKLEEIFVDVVA